VLQALAPQLSGEQVQRALEVVRAFYNEGERAQVLQALAPQLSGEQVQRSLEAALALRNETAQAQVLQALAPQLSGEQAGRTLVAARVSASAHIQALLLSAVKLHFKGAELSQQLRLARWADMGSTPTRKDLEVALAKARAVNDADAEARTVAVATTRSTTAERTQAPFINIPSRLRESEAWLSFAMSSAWSREEHERAFDIVSSSGAVETSEHIALFEVTVGQLSPVEIEQVLPTILALTDDTAKAWLLDAAANQLSNAGLQQALESALTMRERTSQALLLTGLAKRLSPWDRQRAIAAANASDRLRGGIIAALGNAELDRQTLARALDSALAILDEAGRAMALTALASRATGWERTRIVDALETLQAEEHRNQVMLALVLAQEGNESEHATELASQLAALTPEPLPSLDPGLAWERLTGLKHLMEISTAQPVVVDYIRRQVVEVLYRMREWSRRDVLTLLGVGRVLAGPEVPAEWPYRELYSVLNVCHGWEWI
jgi:hypothetical protein